MALIIRSPETAEEWNQYFDLRWQLLREPWQQARGSEKDELEENSIHRCALVDGKIVAVGRFHFLNPKEAQIRYMAVMSEFQQQGIGQSLLQSLEARAVESSVNLMTLNARENAVAFYKKNNYVLIEESHTLYGKIKHFKMKRILTNL